MRRAREPRLLAREPLLLALSAATAAVDTLASFLRHVHLQSGLDLAIFDQVVWHYSRFEAPFSSIKGENILGDHFHPLVAVLAPLYWVWSDPRMLLLAQSVLVAASIIPVFLFAERRLGRTGAYLLAAAYAAYWGLQVGVVYDFHEVAFAPLLIALAILLSDRRRWGWFWVVIALLLLDKENFAVFVVVFGIYLLTLREFRHAIALVVVGLVWYELTTRVLIPHFNPRGVWVQWTYQELGKDAPAALWALIQAPWRLFTISFSTGQKAHTIVWLFLPFLFLSIPSRLFILALPLLGERFLSTSQQFWGEQYHYSMAIAPVLAMGAAAGLKNLLELLPGRRRALLMTGAAAAMLAVSLGLSVRGNPQSALYELTKRGTYQTPPFAHPAYAAIAHVPSSASLASSDFVLPHASERQDVRLLAPHSARAVQYTVLDVLFPQCCDDAGNDSFRTQGAALNSALLSATPVYFQRGWLVARAAPRGTSPANGVLAPMDMTSASRLRSLRTQVLKRLGGFGPCYGKWVARDPTAGECFGRAESAFSSAERALEGQIAVTALKLDRGCAELSAEALHRLRVWRPFVERFASAGRSGDRAAFAAAGSALVADQNYFDPGGQLDRFLLLCSPR